MCSKNDQRQFSPSDINTQSLLKVMRIKNHHKREIAMIVYQLISPHSFKGNVRKSVWKILGLKRLKICIII